MCTNTSISPWTATLSFEFNVATANGTLYYITVKWGGFTDVTWDKKHLVCVCGFILHVAVQTTLPMSSSLLHGHYQANATSGWSVKDLVTRWSWLSCDLTAHVHAARSEDGGQMRSATIFKTQIKA